MKSENILTLGLYINDVKVKCTISKLKNQQFKEIQYRNLALIRKWTRSLYPDTLPENHISNDSNQM